MQRREGWGKHFPPINRKSILRSSDSTELTVADALFMSSRIAPESLKYQPLAARAAASCDCIEEEAAAAAMANSPGGDGKSASIKFTNYVFLFLFLIFYCLIYHFFNLESK